jgi:acrylyl-CoA reductase (NADPH)
VAELEGTIATLSGLGCRIIASTGRLEEGDYLRSLGAAEIIERRTLAKPGAPIASERWAGAVNSVGSYTIVNVFAQAQYRDVITACGLAHGLDLPGSDIPFILRNVTLAGFDSINAPQVSTSTRDCVETLPLSNTIKDIKAPQRP